MTNSDQDHTKELALLINLPEDKFHSSLKEKIQNSNSNAHLEIIKRLIQENEALKNQKSQEYNRKVLEVYERYKVLENMYKEEHLRVLSLSDDKFQLETKQKENQTVIDQQAQQILELQKELAKQKDEFAKAATRQGQGRRTIEEKLMAKEILVADMKKKIHDFEAASRTNLDQIKHENIKLRNVITYFNQQGVLTPQHFQQYQRANQQQ